MYVCYYNNNYGCERHIKYEYLSVSKVFDDDTLKMLPHNNLELKRRNMEAYLCQLSL